MQIQQQETCARVPRAEAIAQLNDALRRGDRSAIGAKGGRYFITQGVEALPGYDPGVLAAALASYDGFDPDNDPHGERDFGDFTLFGADMFWKIDYYDQTITYGSDDPADPAKTTRVLTVMLTREY